MNPDVSWFLSRLVAQTTSTIPRGTSAARPSPGGRCSCCCCVLCWASWCAPWWGPWCSRRGRSETRGFTELRRRPWKELFLHDQQNQQNNVNFCCRRSYKLLMHCETRGVKKLQGGREGVAVTSEVTRNADFLFCFLCSFIPGFEWIGTLLVKDLFPPACC